MQIMENDKGKKTKAHNFYQENLSKIDIGYEGMKKTEHGKIENLIKENIVLWNNDCGKIVKVCTKHEINILPNFEMGKCAFYRRSQHEHDVIEEEVKKLLNRGYITESTTNYLSPVVIVKKKRWY